MCRRIVCLRPLAAAALHGHNMSSYQNRRHRLIIWIRFIPNSNQSFLFFYVYNKTTFDEYWLKHKSVSQVARCILYICRYVMRPNIFMSHMVLVTTCGVAVASGQRWPTRLRKHDSRYVPTVCSRSRMKSSLTKHRGRHWSLNVLSSQCPKNRPKFSDILHKQRLPGGGSHGSHVICWIGTAVLAALTVALI